MESQLSSMSSAWSHKSSIYERKGTIMLERNLSVFENMANAQAGLPFA